ncbi:class I SAM-dependent methyltransferase [Jeotgalibaca caeni]|uniref:class I SAM-dependent methyltransferase n=1 Tax=Jeotgalibaca caeni TaxID=3028623 RepID=UPI00237EA087|nr:class I SAM-dependent methyltransferase [Jeotgalibaca caeni]MDE1549674.1 class I SAM-dependent methyltransferase [Jeotgalibaca caeni]
MQADLLPDQIIVGVGCGTGTLFLMPKDAQPKAIVKGLDADPQILRLAQKKHGRV